LKNELLSAIFIMQQDKWLSNKRSEASPGQKGKRELSSDVAQN